VLIAGGNETTNTELFDPAKGAWFATGRLNTPRLSGHTATALADGRVLVFGGQSGPNPDSREVSAEIYDPTTQVWTPTGSLGHVRYHASATLLSDGRVLVVAGGGALAELFDPATGRWHFTEGPLFGRDGATTLLQDGTVLMTGGTPNPGEPDVLTVQLFDPAQLTWRHVGNLSAGRGGHTATLLSSGKVLVAGGVHIDRSTGIRVWLKSAEVFDPSTSRSTLTTPPNTAPAGGTATLLRPTDPALLDRVLIAGGDDGPQLDNSLDRAELFLLGRDIVVGPPL
jgi:N-acetylneuraminic acid mutarotase